MLTFAAPPQAVVLANRLIRQYLVNYARPLIYSTVMPHMNVKAIENSIEMLQLGFGDQASFHPLVLFLQQGPDFFQYYCLCVSLLDTCTISRRP